MAEQLIIPTESDHDYDRPLSETEERVYQFLIPRLEETAIDMDDFKEVKGEKIVTNDKERVRQRIEELEELGQSELDPRKKRSKILEAILTEQIEMSDWFGPNTSTVFASEYDDLFNSLDLILEFGDDNDKDIKYDPLGIDVTSTTERIEKKLTKIKEHMLRYNGSLVRYFRSERENPETKLEQLPRLIIGVEPELVQELSQLWLEANKHRIEGKNPLELSEETKQKIREAREALSHHRTIGLLLQEIKLQIEELEKLTKENKRWKDSKKFKNLLARINALLKEKNLNPEDEAKNNEDKIYKAIRESLERVFH